MRVVYDSVGQATFAGSLDCLRAAGLLVRFGSASGAVPPFLAARGSLFLTRATLYSYTARREDWEEGAQEPFRRVASGEVKPGTPRTWPLARAAEAHQALEGRKTTASIVLVP